jgi:hypothetical protein
MSFGTSSDVDSGVREAEQAALRAPGTSSSASFARWTCKNSARRARSLKDTLLIMLVVLFCRLYKCSACYARDS